MLLVFFSCTLFSQVTIASQNFDSLPAGLGYTVSSGTYVNLNSYSESSPNSLQFSNANGSNNRDSDVVFNTVDIASYSNVSVTISFASVDVDNNEDLFLDISYNGNSFNQVAKLIDGHSPGGVGETWNWGTPDEDDAVSTNPYTFNVPIGYSSISVRVRATSLDNNEFFYIDNLVIKGQLYCPLNTWTGAISDNWNTTGNWSCGNIPTISTNVLIPSLLASGNFPVIYSGAAYGMANNIEFQSRATLKVVNNYIQIAGTLLLNGSIDLQGESQLIQNNGSALDDASTGFIEIDQQGQGNKYRYNDWASPVIKTNTSNGNTFKVSDVLRDGTDPSNPKVINFVGGYDGSRTASPISIANYWIYKYINKPEGSYSGWEQIGSNGSLKPAEGFLMKGTGEPGAGEQNYVFVGKPNNGTIQLPVGAGNNYLIGNPYPSSIDLDKFIDDNTPAGTGSSITGTIYFWEHYGGNSHNLAQYQAGYATYTKGGGVPATAGALAGVSSSGTPAKTPQRYLPVAQGFFVVGDDTGGGTIEFNNSQRTFVPESSGNSIFMKSENAKNAKSLNNTSDTRQKFRIGFDSKKIDHRQLLLTLDEKTTDGIDWGYDAELYEEFKDDMYWITDNKKLVIQAVSQVNSKKHFLIGVKVQEKGVVKIKLDQIENEDSNLDVFLKDSLLGINYNLKEGNFEKEIEAGTFNNRFYIVFKDNKTEKQVVKDEFVAIDLDIDYDSYLFSILKSDDLKLTSAHLYNYLGQKIKSWTFQSNQLEGIPLNVAVGVYILQIETNKGLVNKKILIK